MDNPRHDITAYVGRPTEAAVRAARAIHGHSHHIPDNPFLAAAHPLDQMEGLRGLSEGAVIVTNSPYLVDLVAPERVFVVAPDGDDVVFRPLTAHPEWERWQRQLQSGEFWMSMGEGWVLEGAPPSCVVPG